MLADDLDIPHYVFNYQDRFKEDVIDQFADDLEAGVPAPPGIIFSRLLEYLL